MEKVIFFGASKAGLIAEIKYRNEYDIVCYCDNDQRKRGKCFNGYRVINLDDYKKLHNGVKIFITSSYYREIVKQLEANGINNYEIFSLSINPFIDSSPVYGKEIKEISLENLLKKHGKEISLTELTFITNGSGLLDYLFLRLLATEFKVKNYLEIGSFIGESISVLSDVVEKCYSISLPEDDFSSFFESINMDNFSSFLLKNKENVIKFREDSQKFDYGKIEEDIDMVFIDGDHSYKGVFIDTRNIFTHVDLTNCIVVWHDFKTAGKYRLPVINAVFDATPNEYHKNIFSVSNNMCGIYIPDKYLDEFSIGKKKNALFTYDLMINMTEQRK